MHCCCRPFGRRSRHKCSLAVVCLEIFPSFQFRWRGLADHLRNPPPGKEPMQRRRLAEPFVYRTEASRSDLFRQLEAGCCRQGPTTGRMWPSSGETRVTIGAEAKVSNQKSLQPALGLINQQQPIVVPSPHTLSQFSYPHSDVTWGLATKFPAISQFKMRDGEVSWSCRADRGVFPSHG